MLMRECTYCISSGRPFRVIHRRRRKKQSRKKTWLVSEYTWHLLFHCQFQVDEAKKSNKTRALAVGEQLGSAGFSDSWRWQGVGKLRQARSLSGGVRRDGGVWWEEPPLCRAHWADKEAGPQPWQWMRARLPWEYSTFMAERRRFPSLFVKRIKASVRCGAPVSLPATVFLFPICHMCAFISSLSSTVKLQYCTVWITQRGMESWKPSGWAHVFSVCTHEFTILITESWVCVKTSSWGTKSACILVLQYEKDSFHWSQYQY